MDIDLQILVELTRKIFARNQSPVRIEKNLVQKNTVKDKTESYTVQLDSTYLTIHRFKNSQWSEAQQQKFFDQLNQLEQQRKLYYQIVETEEPLVGSKSGISEDALNQLRGGDLGKSGPGPRAKAAALKSPRKTGGGSIFAQGFTPQRQDCSRPINKPLSCRNSAKLKEDQFHLNQYPPGCSKESFFKYSADTRFKELSIDPQTNQNNPKSRGEACSILQAEDENILKNPRRPDLEKGEPNLDFVIEGPENYKYADVKTPRDPSSFTRNPKNRCPSLSKVAKSMGKQIRNQKGGSKDVLHIVNLFHIPSDKIKTFKESLIQGIGSSDGIAFINDI